MSKICYSALGLLLILCLLGCFVPLCVNNDGVALASSNNQLTVIFQCNDHEYTAYISKGQSFARLPKNSLFDLVLGEDEVLTWYLDNDPFTTQTVVYSDCVIVGKVTKNSPEIPDKPTTFTVTFSCNEVFYSVSVLAGQKIENLPPPNVFNLSLNKDEVLLWHWNDGEFTANSVINASCTVYGEIVKLSSHTVIYKNAGVVLAQNTYLLSEEFSAPSILNDMEIAEFYLDENYARKFIVPAVLDANYTLYVKFAPKYNVILNIDGADKTYFYGEKLLPPVDTATHKYLGMQNSNGVIYGNYATENAVLTTLTERTHYKITVHTGDNTQVYYLPINKILPSFPNKLYTDSSKLVPCDINAINDDCHLYQRQYGDFWTVTFLDDVGNVIGTYEIANNQSALPPVPPQKEGYKFNGWDRKYNKITANTVIFAKYSKITPVTAEVPEKNKKLSTKQIVAVALLSASTISAGVFYSVKVIKKIKAKKAVDN